MMMICYALFFRAISELRRLKVLNLAMCTGVTLTGICSLVKSGKNTRYFNYCNVVWLGMYKAVNLKFYKNYSLHLVLVNNQMIFALDAVCLVCDVLL